MIRASEIEKPVVAVDLADGVRGAVAEDIIEVLNLLLPVTVGTGLTLGEHERLARIKKAIHSSKLCFLGGNLEDAR